MRISEWELPHGRLCRYTSRMRNIHRCSLCVYINLYIYSHASHDSLHCSRFWIPVERTRCTHARVRMPKESTGYHPERALACVQVKRASIVAWHKWDDKRQIYSLFFVNGNKSLWYRAFKRLSLRMKPKEGADSFVFSFLFLGRFRGYVACYMQVMQQRALYVGGSSGWTKCGGVRMHRCNFEACGK